MDQDEGHDEGCSERRQRGRKRARSAPIGAREKLAGRSRPISHSPFPAQAAAGIATLPPEAIATLARPEFRAHWREFNREVTRRP